MANRPRHSTIYYSVEIDLEARAFIEMVSCKDPDGLTGHFVQVTVGVFIPNVLSCFASTWYINPGRYVAVETGTAPRDGGVSHNMDILRNGKVPAWSTSSLCGSSVKNECDMT